MWLGFFEIVEDSSVGSTTKFGECCVAWGGAAAILPVWANEMVDFVKSHSQNGGLDLRVHIRFFHGRDGHYRGLSFDMI